MKHQDFIVGALKSNEQSVRVVFVKADGSERVMHCTLNPKLIPTEQNETKTTRAVSTEACRVFDVEKQAWRSFRFDSVIEASFIERGTEVIYTP